MWGCDVPMAIITGYYANLTRSIKIDPWPVGPESYLQQQWSPPQSPSKQRWKRHKQLFQAYWASSVWCTDGNCWMADCFCMHSTFGSTEAGRDSQSRQLVKGATSLVPRPFFSIPPFYKERGWCTDGNCWMADCFCFHPKWNTWF